MKKAISLSLACLIGFGSVAPNFASAAENIDSKQVLEKNDLIVEPEIKALKSKEENVTKFEFTYNDETVIAEHNTKTGEFSVDGEIVAIITSGKGKPVDSQIQVQNNISALASYPTYKIGSPGQSVWVHKYYDVSQVKFLSTQLTVVAVAAALSAAFLFDDKPSIKASALISAATTVLSTITTNATYNMTFNHYSGKANTTSKSDFWDSVGVFKGTVTGTNRICTIDFYYSWDI
ncbi:hypothetical protein QUF56_12405 [Ureibacillus composti]|uniref:Uncharacterized protein n=1 Tax=Lysinibacillus composti TaxID=720633 RepID=A0A3N9UJJ8_9BACI|nr:hypothetical protein [Lysinibacillus composti]MBM7607274.1 hypothetical protein [Lysinibacillus composti]MDM5334030.1 hypothetical protein [Ureibacillus composti]RQW76150.1 hypothetical protein EBB45_00965 [Lysinibacillus composti]